MLKKDEAWHMCMESCAINKSTVKCYFPIPMLDNMWTSCQVLLFLKVDLKNGYYQMCIRLGDGWKTAFK